MAKESVEQELLVYWFLFEKVSFAVAVFILITLLSAVMSSADSYIIASGTILSYEIVKGFLHKEAGDRELIFWSRLGAIVAGAIGFAFAINIHNIILLWVSGIAISTIIAIPEYLMVWFSKRMNTEGAFCGMLAGGLYCAALMLSGSVFQFFTIVVGCAVNSITAYVVALLKEKPGREEIDKTYYWGNSLSGIPKIPK